MDVGQILAESYLEKRGLKRAVFPINRRLVFDGHVSIAATRQRGANSSGDVWKKGVLNRVVFPINFSSQS